MLSMNRQLDVVLGFEAIPEHRNVTMLDVVDSEPEPPERENRFMGHRRDRSMVVELMDRSLMELVNRPSKKYKENFSMGQ